MREMKDSGIEWIGEIPVDWTLRRGKTIFAQRLAKGNQSKVLLAATQKYGMLPQSEVEGVVQVKEDANLQQFRTVHKKDFVISLRSFQGGFEYSQYEGVCSPAYQVLYNTTPICHNYYRFLFKSDGFIQKMNSMTVGIREGKNIQYSDFANSLIPVPPIDQQDRIADYLDRKCSQIDAIIARQQEAIEKLKDYKLSVITEAVTKGLNPDVPMKDSGIEWIGKTPKHWQLTKIKWVADTCSGGTPPSGDLSFYDGGINWVCSYDLHEDAIKCTQRTLSEEGAEIIAGKMQKPNSILIAMYGGSGTIGNSGILSCYARTNQAVCSVYFDEKLMNPKFALYQTIFMRKYWMYYAVGSRKDPNISQDTIRNMHYIIPPMQEQEAIVEWIESRINVVECIQRKKSNIIEKLADYKKSLIYEVVTGKKEV